MEEIPNSEVIKTLNRYSEIILWRVTFETLLSFTFLNPAIQRNLCK